MQKGSDFNSVVKNQVLVKSIRSIPLAIFDKTFLRKVGAIFNEKWEMISNPNDNFSFEINPSIELCFLKNCLFGEKFFLHFFQITYKETCSKLFEVCEKMRRSEKHRNENPKEKPRISNLIRLIVLRHL